MTSLQQLEAMILARAAVPKNGSTADVIGFLLDAERVRTAAVDARRQAKQFIEIVRCAAEPNQWKNASDEEIAAELVRSIEQRKQGARRKP